MPIAIEREKGPVSRISLKKNSSIFPTGQEKPREERVGAQFSWSHSAASCCAFLFGTVAISYSLVPDSGEDSQAGKKP